MLWQGIPTVSTQGLLFLLTESGQSTTHSSTIMERYKAGSTRVEGTTQRYGEEHITSLLHFYSKWGTEWAHYDICSHYDICCLSICVMCIRNTAKK